MIDESVTGTDSISDELPVIVLIDGDDILLLNVSIDDEW
jgi:hypothetical protein